MILQLPQTSLQQTSLSAGSGLLEFCRFGERTVLTQALASSPLKLLNPKNHGRAAWVYMSSYGGGLLGGDAFHLDVSVGTGASALLSTQASTKIYRSKKPSSQTIDATVGNDALLVVAPDPVVPFAHSNFTQRQTFQLSERANLVVVDWLSAGRWGCGERWAFDRYQSRIDIFRGEQRVILESLLLDGASGELPRRMGRFNTLLCAIVTGPELAQGAAEIRGSLAQSALQRNAEMVATASPLKESGVMLRIAGVSPEAAGRALRGYLSFLCALLGDDPWARKW